MSKAPEHDPLAWISQGRKERPAKAEKPARPAKKEAPVPKVKKTKVK
ncbi:MAG TPA: hypothetical protein VJ505_06575 [Holophagaceae bacterium]|nr:hypothetical protein [Holophagaceae bacterium]